MTRKETCVSKLLRDCPWGQSREAETYAPANIALCKYWGKRDRDLNLPITDSLSISLGPYGSHCHLSLQEGPDAYFLHGEAVETGSVFAERLRAFLDLFRGPDGYGYRVEARNSIPTAAGFASSASGFAALVQALDAVHGWQLAPPALSVLARLGSGSACRSLWKGFVHWHAGTREDGLDSHAEPLDVEWPAFRVGLLTVSAGQKAISSREAMNRTVETSALYAAWPDQVARDLATMRAAIERRDFAALGGCAESNALAMHATMLGARPPVLYWLPDSVRLMRKVQDLRAAGVPVYFTMDAGPNLKLLFLAADTDAIAAALPDMQVVVP